MEPSRDLQTTTTPSTTRMREEMQGTLLSPETLSLARVLLEAGRLLLTEPSPSEQEQELLSTLMTLRSTLLAQGTLTIRLSVSPQGLALRVEET